MIVITTIDALPNRCYECPCHDGDGYCQADKEQRCSEYRPYWCPLKEITDKDTNVPSKWISVKDEMPAENYSMFFKLYGTPKWRDAMWKEESDNVLVAISFEDGSQFVTSGYTQDGKWHTGISKMLPYTVTHWMQMPEPPEVMQDGIQ